MLEHEYIAQCDTGAAISHYVSLTLHNIASPCKLKVLVRLATGTPNCFSAGPIALTMTFNISSSESSSWRTRQPLSRIAGLTPTSKPEWADIVRDQETSSVCRIMSWIRPRLRKIDHLSARRCSGSLPKFRRWFLNLGREPLHLLAER